MLGGHVGGAGVDVGVGRDSGGGADGDGYDGGFVVLV